MNNNNNIYLKKKQVSFCFTTNSGFPLCVCAYVWNTCNDVATKQTDEKHKKKTKNEMKQQENGRHAHHYNILGVEIKRFSDGTSSSLEQQQQQQKKRPGVPRPGPFSRYSDPFHTKSSLDPPDDPSHARRILFEN